MQGNSRVTIMLSTWKHLENGYNKPRGGYYRKKLSNEKEVPLRDESREVKLSQV